MYHICCNILVTVCSGECGGYLSTGVHCAIMISYDNMRVFIPMGIGVSLRSDPLLLLKSYG